MSKHKFLQIIKIWAELLKLDSPDEILQSVELSWEQEDRIYSLTKKLIGALDEKQRSVEAQVQEVLDRMRANSSYSSAFDEVGNDDIAFTIGVRVVNGLGNMLRQQVPRADRRKASVLRVDWNNELGVARWVGVGDQFILMNVLQFTAKHVGGAEPLFLNALSSQLLGDFREQLVHFPRLDFVESDGTVATYHWSPANVEHAEEQHEVKAADPLQHLSPIFAFLEDAQQNARQETASTAVDDAYYEAQLAVSQVEMDDDDPISNDVADLLKRCHEYVGEDAQLVDHELSKASFAELCRSIAMGSDKERQDQQAKVVSQLNRHVAKD